MMAVLMPTSSPAVLISAPPELPGLMAASVWMKSSYCAIPDMVVGDDVPIRRHDHSGAHPPSARFMRRHRPLRPEWTKRSKGRAEELVHRITRPAIAHPRDPGRDVDDSRGDGFGDFSKARRGCRGDLRRRTDRSRRCEARCL